MSQLGYLKQEPIFCVDYICYHTVLIICKIQTSILILISNATGIISQNKCIDPNAPLDTVTIGM